MTLKNLTIKVHGPKRAARDRMDNGASPQPELVHAPVGVPQADAAPAPEEPRALEAAMVAPEAPAPRDVADAVYKMFLEDAKRARLRGGS